MVRRDHPLAVHSLVLADHTLSAGGVPVIAGLDPGLAAEPDALGQGLFVTARAARTGSRLLFLLGEVPELQRFTLCHRDEPFWMRPRAGEALADVPPETQFLLARLARGWLLLVPLFAEPFRFSLRGRSDGRLELLGETGDAHTFGDGGLALFVASGDDPFALLRRGAASVASRIGLGRLRRDKPLPAFVDRFGWCTWDAFYQDVSAERVAAGLASFQQAGVSPRFVILDDGWQCTRALPTGERRLSALAANDSFAGDLSSTVQRAKREFGVETFLVWHAIIGYWGGVDREGLPGYDVVDQVRRFGEGILAHQPSVNEQWWGSLVGLVPAQHAARFFDDYHARLAAQGVDGVKVDNQAVLEGVAQGQGGRVALNRAYRAALESSVERHFQGRLIDCMASAQETWYGSTHSSLTRGSIDFFPARPETHAAHLYTNAHVGLWFGEFMLLDWDMFQSAHEWGAFHAAGRALSGGPVYVSDAPGRHDVALLRQLVCADGSVLRGDGPGLPTLDTLCSDPTREHCALKIWNKNGERVLLGVFDARAQHEQSELAGDFGASDVPDLPELPLVCFAQRAGTLELLVPGARRRFTLAPRGFELFTLVPLRDGFAAIGLADKLNSGGAIRSEARSGSRYRLRLRDAGRFLAYAERPPTLVEVAGRPHAFSHDPASKTLAIELRDTNALELELDFC
ncbi:MAG: Sip1-related alpha-galactosidase [Polyangiaceae bacterium]